MGESNPFAFHAMSRSSWDPEPASPTSARLLAAVALIGWAFVVVIEYATTPLLLFLPLLGIPIILGAWVLAIATSIAAIHSFARGRTRRITVLSTVVAVGTSVLISITDWNAVYIDSQFALHRSTFDSLATAHDAGTLSEDTPLPQTMRYLTLDGNAHIQSASVSGATDSSP